MGFGVPILLAALASPATAAAPPPGSATGIALAPRGVNYVGASVGNGQLRSIRAIAKGDTRALVATFEISLEKSGTMLEADNKTDYLLKYHLLIRREGGRRFRPTSTCPLYPGIGGFEQWPFRVAAMRITGIEILPRGAAGVCRY